jgi:predicted dehydrogenase
MAPSALTGAVSRSGAAPLAHAVAPARSLPVAVVGTGYWGPRIVRNFARHAATELLWICDSTDDRAIQAAEHAPGVGITDSLDTVLDDPRVEAVALVTPAATHADLALKCLRAGRHVLVEKPLACSVADGEMLVREAEKRGLVLMLDHTYCYTPAVRRLRELIRGGGLGDIQYVDSVRLNLGLVQRDIDVVWDLAPHDLSILDFVLPEGDAPIAVAAHGADPIGAGRVCVGYSPLPLRSGAIAHVNVNWLSPTKIRTTVIGGSKGVVVWDDLHPNQRLSIYDRGVELVTRAGSSAAVRELLSVSYRVGDMVSPVLPETEALANMVGEFAAAIAEERTPVTDGASGLRVLRILEAASQSMANGGVAIPLPAQGVGIDG